MSINEEHDKNAPPANEERPRTNEGGDSGPTAADAVPEQARAPRKAHDQDETKALRARLKKKDHEIKDLKSEVESLKDRYFRAAAEIDNQRKRAERDKEEFFQYALASLLRDILAVLDNFERALKNREARDASGFHSGVELIAKQIQDVLKRRGVTEVEAEGRAFDPTVHQAVVTEESPDVNEPHVGEVLQKGYRLHDRLLRPALVKVIVPPRGEA
jgi:molecular chaperone GrpE